MPLKVICRVTKRSKTNAVRYSVFISACQDKSSWFARFTSAIWVSFDSWNWSERCFDAMPRGTPALHLQMTLTFLIIGRAWLCHRFLYFPEIVASTSFRSVRLRGKWIVAKLHLLVCVCVYVHFSLVSLAKFSFLIVVSIFGIDLFCFLFCLVCSSCYAVIFLKF